MVNVIYYILLAMTGIYFTFLALGGVINKTFKFKICAICATVVSTWSVLLVMKLIGYTVNQVVLAILMGQSMVGIMYFLEKRARSTDNDKLRLLKPFVIIFGTLVVYWIISGVYG